MHHQTSTLRLVVALTYLCCSLQSAQPLSTTSHSDDYEGLQGGHTAADTFDHTDTAGVTEHLQQQHHVRHRTSHHMRKSSAHHSIPNQQPHFEKADGLSASESAADALASSPSAALAGGDDATESLNFLRVTHLHKPKYKPAKFGTQYESAQRLHLQHQKFYGDKLELEPNSIHTHAHHKHHAQNSRTTTTAATTTTTTTMATSNNNAMPIASEKTMELVKPTSHPTKSAERNTIKLDEVNKGTQNYYQQPIIHLKQQQQQQHLKQQEQHQRQQVHYKHHKLQPAADLNRSKHTMTSVQWDQPPLPSAHKTHNKLVHTGSQINVDTDDGEDNVMAKAHEQPAAGAEGDVGKERKTTQMSSESDSGLTTEADPRSSSDKASDYATDADADAAAVAATDDDDADDEGIEYYDYAVDDESTAAEQHTLAAPDVGGFSYGGYDSGIDGIEADWYTSNSKNEYHQQQKQQQQQQIAQKSRHYEEQLQRRQQWHWEAQEQQHRHHELQHQHQQQHLHRHHHQQQQQQQQQQQLEYEYQTEHSRVARDHHRVQAEELHNNHLAYDTSSDDDEYPDDEPGRDSDEPTGDIGELTKHKQNTLGTREGVNQAHHAYRQMQYMRFMAQDHIKRMKLPTACRWPMPRVVPVSNYTSVTYNPQYTILYRCGEDTGCCRSKGQVCTVKEYENVTLYFVVESVNSSNSHYDTLKLRNDTQCECVNRSQLSSTSDSFTRGKRSDLTYVRRTNNNPDAVCRCPREFDVFQEDIRWQSLRQRHEMRNPYGTRTYNCRCDCEDANTSCQRFKNGDEGFAMDDRRCIAERICSVPNCSFGIYNEQTGRCPRSNRKLKRHNSGFG